MPEVYFEEIECSSALNRVHAPGLPFRWTLNPYRGCQHACVYCFARGTHRYLGYDPGRDFERRIVVKVNIAEALRRDLARPSWRRQTVAIGTACDPYQQAEMKYGLTRRCLEVMLEFANPVSLVTKSPAITKDLDLLEALSRVAEVSVAFSISTLDAEIWRRIEPETANPGKRLEAMATLARSGVRTGVLLAPILPGITDDPRDLEAVVRAAAEHGASFIGDVVLHLKPGSREWFMPFLREAYPHLQERYWKFYRGPYAPHSYTSEVHEVVRRLKERFGMAERETAAAPSRGQLQLAI
jgi:DNA repair photolyase